MERSYPMYSYHEKMSCVKHPYNLFEGYGSYGAINAFQNEIDKSVEVTTQIENSYQLRSSAPSIPLYAKSQSARYLYKDRVNGPLQTARINIKYARKMIKEYGNPETPNGRLGYENVKHLQEQLVSGSSSSPDVIIPPRLRRLLDVYADIDDINYIPTYNSDFLGGSIKCCEWDGARCLFHVTPRSKYPERINLLRVDLDRGESTPIIKHSRLTSFSCRSTIYGIDVQKYHDAGRRKEFLVHVDPMWIETFHNNRTSDLASTRVDVLEHAADLDPFIRVSYIRVWVGQCGSQPARMTASMSGRTRRTSGSNTRRGTSRRRLVQHPSPSDRYVTPFSPYISGEMLIADAEGNYKILAADGRELWVVEGIHPRFSCVERWRTGHYGAHPRAVVMTDQTAMRTMDVRSGNSTDLFALPNRILYKTERLVSATQHPANHFVHCVASDYHLFVLDERFPGKPVLSWQHLMLRPPPYMAVATDVGSNDVILLASQNPPETCCFQTTPSTASQPCCSSSTPWKLSDISDFTEFPEMEKVTKCRMVGERFATSLVGVAAMSCDTESFVAFQLDASGDVFHQTYRRAVADPRSDKTCSAGPTLGPRLPLPDDIVRHCRDWVGSLKLHPLATKPTQRKYRTKRKRTSFSMEALAAPSSAHPACPLCRSSETGYRSDDCGETCQRCGQTSSFAADLALSVDSDTIIQSPQPGSEAVLNPENFLPESLELLSLTDPDSLIVLSLWKGDDRLESLVKKRDDMNRSKRRSFFHPRKASLMEIPQDKHSSRLTENSVKFSPQSLIATLTSKLTQNDSVGSDGSYVLDIPEVLSETDMVYDSDVDGEQIVTYSIGHEQSPDIFSPNTNPRMTSSERVPISPQESGADEIDATSLLECRVSPTGLSTSGHASKTTSDSLSDPLLISSNKMQNIKAFVERIKRNAFDVVENTDHLGVCNRKNPNKRKFPFLPPSASTSNLAPLNLSKHTEYPEQMCDVTTDIDVVQTTLSTSKNISESENKFISSINNEPTKKVIPVKVRKPRTTYVMGF